ncbi:uncharacterized protein IL334_004546 [Kwoniella shivajii]|uniref:Zn(2)-C6 fungal-type domain-containing protein n=1 Tax=Kwoniella shivajii TaxID=564305 RepID=A0ABZ1D1Z8_9TREE|nr:hypothetical protein IL334_004546 [Kwoniella shivajii]
MSSSRLTSRSASPPTGLSASNRRTLSPGSGHRRTSRACLQCRKRKQRCDGASVPCERCQRVGKECSFLLDGIIEGEKENDGVEVKWGSGQAKVLQGMKDDMDILRKDESIGLIRHFRMENAQRRIQHLERGLSARQDNLARAGSPVAQIMQYDVPETQVPPANPPALSPAALINGRFSHAPIQTLHGLLPSPSSLVPPSTLPQHGTNGVNNLDTQARRRSPALDPVSRGVLSAQEAQRLFDIFFAACHELAPCSSSKSQSNASDLRQRSPFLFTSICLIGARYWEMDDPVSSTRNWLHPRYSDLVSISDEHIRNLLLKPSSSDFNLSTIQALLLSIQWPALDIESHTDGNGYMGDSPVKSRFNDAYAWLMIGIAIRFAKYIGLNDCTEINYSDQNVDEDSLAKMRIWLNLISIDRHLTLTAGLPASLEAPPSHIVRAFGSHPKAQSGDLKLAGLSELVSIVHRAAQACGDVSLRRLDAISLKVANLELDEWEKQWSLILGINNAPTFRQQMPFTALRWYRLALNAIPIGVALGEVSGNLMTPTPTALGTCVEAAFQLIWQYSSEATSERPERGVPSSSAGYTMNFMALSSFMFAVDSYWITHAYAAVFLVLVYDRGCIDAELNPYPYISSESPPPVLESSRLYRIIRFASTIFDGICQGATHHPAIQYRSIVANALHTLSQYKAQEIDINAVGAGIDEMLNALLDPGQDWAFLRDSGYTI